MLARAFTPSRIRSVPGNTAAMLLARVLTTLAQAGAFALVEKGYGTHTLDRYAVAFAAATFVGLSLDFGTGTWATRELALRRPVCACLRARLPMLGLVAVGLALGVGAHDLDTAQALEIVAMGTVLAGSYLAKGLFMGRRMHEREAIFAALESCLMILLLTGSYLQILPHLSPLLYTTMAYAAGALGRWLTMPAALRPSRGAGGVGWWFRTMTPYGAQNMVMMASTQLDVVLLAALWLMPMPGGVAAYALAMRVYYAAPMPLDALSSALLPRFVERPGQHRLAAILGTVLGTLIAASTAALFAWIAPLFGYSEAIVHQLRVSLLILSFSFMARCLAYVLGALVTAQGRQRTRLFSATGSLTVMVTLDLILIPHHGLIGASWAMVAADWVQIAGYGVGVWRINLSARRAIPQGL
jgi:O-antigen/teichoic acid export membrane protein